MVHSGGDGAVIVIIVVQVILCKHFFVNFYIPFLSEAKASLYIKTNKQKASNRKSVSFFKTFVQSIVLFCACPS